MLRSFDTSGIFDAGLDLLFNLIINLEHVHLDPIEFYRNSNRKYTTMHDINWIHPSAECIALL